MNTVNLIYTLINTDVSGTETWTATQDCYCVAELCAAGNDYYNASIILDGIAVARNSNDQIIMVNFPVKQGQIIKKSYGKVTCKFYSMLQNTVQACTIVGICCLLVCYTSYSI